MDYLVIRVVQKEKELKIQYRGFGCKTIEDRHRSLVQEKNAMRYLDEYSEWARDVEDLSLGEAVFVDVFVGSSRVDGHVHLPSPSLETAIAFLVIVNPENSSGGGLELVTANLQIQILLHPKHGVAIEQQPGTSNFLTEVIEAAGVINYSRARTESFDDAVAPYLLNPAQLHDHVDYINKYDQSTTLEELMDYLVIRVVQKEKELKIQYRGFGCKTIEDRHRSLVQEKNAMRYLDEYSGEQAMTLSELDLVKKLHVFRNLHRAYHGYGILYVFIDAKAWNNHFRREIVDVVGQRPLTVSSMSISLARLTLSTSGR
ncbi:unnamed protein product [Heligmosomoides polygyrus]|uniref:RdRp catalytic domain-containing protein n=1 Tax=Heligmosomoides polygyrus TaxID=6339 RepID=A0A183GS91_HELPZ|nr:unnamed protein product [Heligmosomoides polygyrus]